MPPQKRKRGRPVASTTNQDASEQAANTTTQRPRKRARTSTAAMEEAPVATAAPTTKKARGAKKTQGRRRSSLQDVQPEEAQNQPTRKAGPGRPKRQSQAGGDGSDAQEQPVAKKRGPKPGSRPGSKPGPKASPNNKTKKRAPRTSTTALEEAQQPSPQKPSARSQRRSSASTVETADAPPSPEKPYPHIARTTRRIRRSQITAKWSPLKAPSLTAANTILTLAHRPILQRLSQTSQRRQHTFAALRLITNRINRRLSRGIPFPPASGASNTGASAAVAAAAANAREAELDFESVLNGRAALEKQLDPALHAVELLKREKTRMERELERDYETLRNLEAGARGQARQQRDLLKKAHGLAPKELKREDERDGVMVKTEEKDVKGPLFTGLEDEETKAAVLQLGGHVESIRANLQQAEGIVPEMAKSRAALRMVLMKHLDAEQYDRVVLG